MFKKGISYLLVLVAALSILAGCGSSSSNASSQKSASAKGVKLTISAAASMKDALTAVKTAYEEQSPNTLLINFASSGTLQHQIEQGAPADLFLSASEAKMTSLKKEGLIDTSHTKDLLKNDLVLIVPKGSTLGIKSLNDLQKASVSKVSIGIPETVPAGAYAKEALQNTNNWNGLQSKLVLAKDVRQALTYVETGNVEAGIVYRTDAMITNKVKIVGTIPDSDHKPIVYPVGIIKATKHHAQAVDFYNFLQTKKAQAIFEKYGFKTVSSS